MGIDCETRVNYDFTICQGSRIQDLNLPPSPDIKCLGANVSIHTGARTTGKANVE